MKLTSFFIITTCFAFGYVLASWGLKHQENVREAAYQEGYWAAVLEIAEKHNNEIDIRPVPVSCSFGEEL